MLTYLNIKNFAIIANAELDFLSGMTVVTGETGAGKSLVVDTLELALGARAESSIIRHGAEKCEITALFDITNLPNAQEWLKEHELDSDNECIIYRSLNKDGRSRITINNQPCTQQLVRELGSLLVNLHGQHEHQNLLKADIQLSLLDAFTNNSNSLIKLKKLCGEWQTLQSELTKLKSLTEDRNSKIDLLAFELKELDNLALQSDEVTNLHKEHTLLSNAEEIIKNCNEALNIAAENEAYNILHYLNNAKGFIEKVKIDDPKVAVVLDLFNNAIIQVDEAATELRHYLNNIELNQERLEWIEERLGIIYDLARKHKVIPEELIQTHLKLKDNLQQLTNAEATLEDLQNKIQLLENEYHAIATKISTARKSAAQKLSKLITEKMQLLGMPDGQFAMVLQPNAKTSPAPHGLERVEFQVNANLGQSLQPLNKIASGGEISRISLAIQVILANQTTASTLVFDEVDVGIGGKTAEIVGQLLRQLSENTQIICVTHLPQVAACGEHHFKVEKSAQNNQTFITVESLDGKSRIQEIARMLGGISITDRTLAHAEEMLESREIG